MFKNVCTSVCVRVSVYVSEFLCLCASEEACV